VSKRAAAPHLEFQASLFGSAPPALDRSFSTAYRHQLDAASWIDVVPGWLAGADDVFAELVAHARWRHRDRVMWGNLVPEPRLSAGWKEGRVADLAPVLMDARGALSARYAIEFNSGGLNLYRDGRDSVAWHRDRIAKTISHPLVAILTLGSTRRFLVRPYGGGKSIRFDPAAGDLLVTGGLMQRDWEHCVPKAAEAGPRISVTFRHSARRSEAAHAPIATERGTFAV
jgi:alkylated DNA repair dioxygenase AlkB